MYLNLIIRNVVRNNLIDIHNIIWVPSDKKILRRENKSNERYIQRNTIDFFVEDYFKKKIALMQLIIVSSNGRLLRCKSAKRKAI